MACMLAWETCDSVKSQRILADGELSWLRARQGDRNGSLPSGGWVNNTDIEYNRYWEVCIELWGYPALASPFNSIDWDTKRLQQNVLCWVIVYIFWCKTIIITFWHQLLILMFINNTYLATCLALPWAKVQAWWSTFTINIPHSIEPFFITQYYS